MNGGNIDIFVQVIAIPFSAGRLKLSKKRRPLKIEVFASSLILRRATKSTRERSQQRYQDTSTNEGNDITCWKRGHYRTFSVPPRTIKPFNISVAATSPG